MTYYELLSKGEPLLTCVFKSEQGGRLRCRSIYQNHYCPQCGRIDSSAALKETGLDTTFSVEMKQRDLADTFDYMSVVSDRMRRLMESTSDSIEFYQIVNSIGCHLMWPKTIVLPDDSEAFSRSDPCQKCGSYRSVVFGPAAIDILPDSPVGAVMLEGPQGPMPAWYVNANVARQIKQEKMNGVSLVKWIDT